MWNKNFWILVYRVKFKDALDVRAIVLFGGLHGRFDHVLSTLNTMLLHQTSGSDLPVFVIDGENIVTVLREVRIENIDIEKIQKLIPLMNWEFAWIQ